MLGRGPRADPDGAGSVDAGVLAEVAAHGVLGSIVARAVDPSPGQRLAGAVEMLAALEAEIGREGAGREALVRELAAKVRALAPDEGTFAAAPARSVTAPTGVEAEPIRESYFRDHRSPAFVDNMLGPVSASARTRVLRRVAILAGSAALIAAGAFALRGSQAGEATPPPAAPVVSPPAPARDVPAPPSPAVAAVPSGPTSASPAATVSSAPPPPVARGAARGAVPAPTSRVRILCTPWCIPYVDGKAVGPDGRSFAVRVPPGRHRIEARRLDDRLQRQVDVAPGQEASAHFDFDDAAR